MMGDHKIKNGDPVILLWDDKSYQFVTITTKKQKWRGGLDLSSLVGKVYGTTFSANGLTQLKTSELTETTSHEKADNRDLVDNSTAQKLSQEDIEKMKREGASGEEVVKALVENSATFATKTAYSKEKYINKKKKKHIKTVKLIYPSANNVSKALYDKNPSDICYLRSDALAHILLLSNVHAHSSVVVVEECHGLVVGAVAERMGENGRIFHGVTERTKSHVLSYFRLTPKIKSNIKSFKLSSLGKMDSSNTATASHLLSKAQLDVLLPNGADSLIVVTRQLSLSLAEALLSLLTPGHPFVFFSPYIEPLAQVQQFLSEERMAAPVAIFETFYREYQVLDNRTHPGTVMDGGSGYVLSGYRVKSNTETESERKRQRVR